MILIINCTFTKRSQVINKTVLTSYLEQWNTLYIELVSLKYVVNIVGSIFWGVRWGS